MFAKTPALHPLYRARRAEKLLSPHITDFGPPPAHLVEEGRYNHAGHSMLYLARIQKNGTC